MKKYYLVPADVFEINFPEDDLSVYETFYKDVPKNQLIYEAMGQFLSNSESDYDEIIFVLKKELVNDPNKLIDYLEQINVWEKVEFKFTVREFCDLVGII